MLKITIKDGQLPLLLKRIARVIVRGTYKATERASKLLASDYTRRIKRGVGASGEPLRPVTQSTMDSPIRRGGPDKRIRGDVNPNRNIPIVATGATADSIKARKGPGSNSFTVESYTVKGNMILEVNAKMGRDPVQIATPQIDIIEREVLKELDRIF